MSALEGRVSTLQAQVARAEQTAPSAPPPSHVERAQLAALEGELAALRAAGGTGDEAALEAVRSEFVRRNGELEAQLASEQETSRALMSEMEVIGQSFDEASEQSARVLTQLREKDDGNLKLMSDKLKRAEEIRSLKERAVVQQQLYDKLREQSAAQQAALAALQDEQTAERAAHRRRTAVVAELETSREVADRAMSERAAREAELRAELDAARNQLVEVRTYRRRAR